MMKAIAVLFLMSVNALAIEYRVDDGVLVTPKYTLNGSAVWTEADKDKIIATALNTGTGTVKASNFVAYVVTDVDQEVIDEINSENIKPSWSDADKNLKERKSEDYLLDKMFQLQQKITFYESNGADTTELNDEYAKYNARYEKVRK